MSPGCALAASALSLLTVPKARCTSAPHAIHCISQSPSAWSSSCRHRPNPKPVLSQGEQRRQAEEAGRRQGCASCPSSRRVGKGGIGREVGQARLVPSPIRVSIACTHNKVCFLTPPFAPPLAGCKQLEAQGGSFRPAAHLDRACQLACCGFCLRSRLRLLGSAR